MIGQPYDPLSVWQAMAGHAAGIDPDALFSVQASAAKEWGDYWLSVWGLRTPAEPPRDRRFAAPAWSEDAYYRSLRDAYLLASKQLKAAATLGTSGDASATAMAGFMLDQFLNAVSPRHPQ